MLGPTRGSLSRAGQFPEPRCCSHQAKKKKTGGKKLLKLPKLHHYATRKDRSLGQTDRQSTLLVPFGGSLSHELMSLDQFVLKFVTFVLLFDQFSTSTFTTHYYYLFFHLDTIHIIISCKPSDAAVSRAKKNHDRHLIMMSQGHIQPPDLPWRRSWNPRSC